MALSLSFSILESDNRESISITETTGEYNANTNAGGWGAPNPTIASALTATLLIELRNEDGTYTAYETVDLFDHLPNITETPFTITSEDAGFGADSTFPDGIYRLTYTVSGDDGGAYEADTTDIVVLKGAIDCCYSTLAAQASACVCNCDGLNKKLSDLDYYFIQLERSEAALDWVYVNNYLTKIAELCDGCGCGCS